MVNRSLLFISFFVAVCGVVLWYKRKKKLKTISDAETNEQTLSSEEYESKLNQSECNSDTADTLSDASSFASPESSEKSARTKSLQLFTPPKDKVIVNSNVSSSTPAAQSNCIVINSCKVSPSPIKSDNPLYKSKGVQFSEVLNSMEPDISNSNNETKMINFVCNDHINVSVATAKHEKDPIVDDMNQNELEMTKDVESSQCDHEVIDKSGVKNYSSHVDTPEMFLEVMGYFGNNHCTVENGSLHSFESNESAISSQAVDIEKLQAIETDSNDSHSSVLDENSLSYVSDDSECRHLVELKNKGSLSSVLDENSALSSFCEDSEKSLIIESPTNDTSKLESDGDSKNFTAVKEKDSMSITNADLDFTMTPVKEPTQCENSSDFTTVDETGGSDCVENLCSNSLLVDDIVQSMEVHSSDTINSSDSSPLQILPIESIDKFPELNFSVSNQRHLNTSTCSTEALASCDSLSSESNFIPSSNEKSPKSSTAVSDIVSKESLNLSTLENPSIQVENANTTNHVSVIESDNHLCSPSAIHETTDADDPQITAMNISQLLTNPVVPAAQGIESSLNPLDWQAQDMQQCGLLPENKNEEIDAANFKSSDSSPSQYVYEFELPQELCGRLIGKHGKHVKSIKDRSHANVYIKRHPYDQQLKIVVVEGNRSDVNDALEIIRRKYPLSRYPAVSLVKTNMVSTTNLLPESLQLHLPEGASCDVILSSLVNAGHFFLQQPTHPTYPSLSSLDHYMIECYSRLDTPMLPHPVEPGVICAAPVLRGWYRAQVVYVYENEVDCELKFVDYGGFSQAPTSSLRQIRSDFMSLPFQASECYLANVRPVDPAEGWSAEATSTFEELAQGQILQALLVEYASDGLPCVHLYRVQGITSVFINKELVQRGLAIWVDNSHWDPH